MNNGYVKNAILIVIASGNEDYRNLLANQIEKYPDMAVIGMAGDGETAFKKINEYEPDVALVDGIMSKLDGIGLLKRLKGNNKTKVIVMSPVEKEEVINTAFDLGAYYYIVKPLDFSALISVIKSTVRREKASDKIVYVRNDLDDTALERDTADVLRELGVSANLSGYYYIKDGVMMTVKDPSVLKGITKALYPDIAKKHKATASKVERGIRHAVIKCCDNFNPEMYGRIFGFTVRADKDKPTNSEFIGAVAEYIRLKH